MQTDQLIQVPVADTHRRLSLIRYLLHSLGQSSLLGTMHHIALHFSEVLWASSSGRMALWNGVWLGSLKYFGSRGCSELVLQACCGFAKQQCKQKSQNFQGWKGPTPCHLEQVYKECLPSGFWMSLFGCIWPGYINFGLTVMI